MEARKLVDFPGGLELHIGVRLEHALLKSRHCSLADCLW